jgi:hypothetical protein
VDPQVVRYSERPTAVSALAAGEYWEPNIWIIHQTGPDQ